MTGKHGTTAGYQAGCREKCCSDAKYREGKARKVAVARGHQFQVDAAPSRRKVHALNALGWSNAEIGKRLNTTREALRHSINREKIRATTAEKISRVYAELEMKIPTGEQVLRLKRRAEKLGLHPPLAWEDIEAGVLADVSDSTEDLVRRYDLDVVDQVMQYHDFKIPMSPAEKAEVVRRWTRDGKSERALCRLTGWKEGRYR